jgi:nucleoside-diphosphate-sugar epimerase
VRASIELMEADPAPLEHRNAFNIAAFSITPAELAEEIGRHVPGFEVRYDVDAARQAIADSWPGSVDDSAARREWGWRHQYDLPSMVEEMIAHLSARAQPVGGT